MKNHTILQILLIQQRRRGSGVDAQKQNPRYFGVMYKESEDLWNEVAEYIDQDYDYDKIEKIYLSGDGANWIKAGVNLINKSTFVLDRYHLNKAVKVAGAHIKNAEREIWKAIKTCDKPYLKTVRTSGETIDNLPVLNSGKRTQLALALRAIRGI
ncbi:MAG: UPF0236 family protein [Eubacteriales bacterium]|nr:UPF0236 family protein [Eubacteriales bacterium]MDD4583883.1 UPF0236 family protein [Eubacteriales bacterium]